MGLSGVAAGSMAKVGAAQRRVSRDIGQLNAHGIGRP
jgi:hypothetical protein